jgi:hypothetical protein
MAELQNFGLAADEERRPRWQKIYDRRFRGLFGEKPRADLAEALGMVGAEIEILLVTKEARNPAVAIPNNGELGTATVGLFPESVRPLFFHPGGADRVRREDQEYEVGIETFGDFGYYVAAGLDFAFIQPNVYVAVFLEEVREFANKRLVFARM